MTTVTNALNFPITLHQFTTILTLCLLWSLFYGAWHSGLLAAVVVLPVKVLYSGLWAVPVVTLRHFKAHNGAKESGTRVWRQLSLSESLGESGEVL